VTVRIPAVALEALIQLGTSHPGHERDALLLRVNVWEPINRLHWDTWNQVLELLPESEHEAVAKGLVIAEEFHRWSGGSVAAAIWVYVSYCRKFPAQADVLAEWMLAHSTNPWVPFGSNRGSARSLGEHRDQEVSKATRRAHSMNEQNAREELRATKEAVRKRLAPYRARTQKAVSSARADLIAEVEALSAKQRIEHLAWDDRHPLYFYPVEIAESITAVWSDLDRETRNAFMNRVKSITRGPWKQWLKANKDLSTEL
jgi:hypothetical protein